jgi:hypothetical protein
MIAYRSVLATVLLLLRRAGLEGSGGLFRDCVSSHSCSYRSRIASLASGVTSSAVLQACLDSGLVRPHPRPLSRGRARGVGKRLR